MTRGVAGSARTAEDQMLANRDNTRAWINRIDEATGLKNYAAVRSRTPRSYLSYLLSKARTRKVECSITIEELTEIYDRQNGVCALSGVPMTHVLGGGVHRTNENMSLDRIDSSLGYVTGNVQLVCSIVNIMKQSMSNEELVDWCKRIAGVT